jgi:4-amino-4-deoxy-L-arabinose transferase-like glycosyltransferase
MRSHGPAIILTITALAFRLFLALGLPNDEPDDGRLYARIAIDVLEHDSYSIETEPPYSPTFIRVPGYPLLLAGVYAVAGHGNDTAVRVVQAAIDTATCWLVAMLALAWMPKGWSAARRRRGMLAALALAAVCPFTAIYVATILTEVTTIFLVIASALAASRAISHPPGRRRILLFILSGALGGAAALFRPDSGIFVAATGVVIVLLGALGKLGEKRLPASLPGAIAAGAALSLGFAAVLTPWTIRNAVVFGLFQPIAPQSASMPGEFVPSGYGRWLRTWVDDQRYIDPFEWELDTRPITIEQVPGDAFDSPAERERVTALLDRYDNPAPGIARPDTATARESNADSLDAGDSTEDDGDDDGDGDEPPALVKMTPSIDSGFAAIAAERIARAPLRHYILLPARRAVALWFDTHSLYYPFAGELSGRKREDGGRVWLPIFMALTWIYTLLGVIGMEILRRSRRTRRWILLALMLTLPRLAFLSMLENPEPRYVVEYFPLVAALGGVAIAGIGGAGRSPDGARDG